MTHDLKTWPEPFQAVWNGTKVHEVHKADRDFKVGDSLELCEFEPCDCVTCRADEGGKYTGRIICALITYVSHPGTWGLPDDVVVLSIRVRARAPSTGVFIPWETL